MKMKDVGNASLAVFSLGSNLGNRIINLEKAVSALKKRAGGLKSVSGMYESPSWGYDSDQPYINCCLALLTREKPLRLMEIALEIEEEMGRKRKGIGYSDRIIDIDILLVEDLVMKEENLTLPHPRMSERRFVLVPLAEIVPDMRDPVSGLSIKDLLGRCTDTTSLVAI